MVNVKAYQCTRITFMILNVLLVIMGIVVIGLGAYHLRMIIVVTAQRIRGILMLTTGVIVLVSSIIGFWGALKHNKCLLIVYLTSVVFGFLLQILVVVYVYIVFNTKSGKEFLTENRQFIEDYYLGFALSDAAIGLLQIYFMASAAAMIHYIRKDAAAYTIIK